MLDRRSETRSPARRRWTGVLLAAVLAGSAVAPVLGGAPVAVAATLSGVVNTYQKVSAISGTTVTVTGATRGATTPFAVGDRVMLIQMTGVSPAQPGSNMGNYDTATVKAVAGTSITLSAITRTYSPASEAVQLVRMPYDAGTTTVGAAITPAPWDGSTGGVVGMAGGTLTLNSAIDASRTGFTSTLTPTTVVAPSLSTGPGAVSGRGQNGGAVSVPEHQPSIRGGGGGGLGGGGGTAGPELYGVGGGRGGGGAAGTAGSVWGPLQATAGPPAAGSSGGAANGPTDFGGSNGASGGGGVIGGGGGGGGGAGGGGGGTDGGGAGADDRKIHLGGPFLFGIVRCVIAALPALRPTDPTPAPDDAPLASPGLSQRQQEVLRLYAQGSTADHVARQLFVSRETVLDHIRRIRAKYALVDRPAATKVELFQRAVEDGILAPDPPAST